jgi:uncharacterized DUF497 family protein
VFGRLAFLLIRYYVRIEFDPLKRQATLANRGDMARGAEIFAGATLTIPDDCRDYGEPRFITIGRLDGRMVAIIWTPRGAARRIISLRKANDREQSIYGDRLD